MSTPLDELVLQLKRLHRLGSVADLLGWDEQVNLPPGSAGFRGEQMAHLSALLHRESTSPAFIKSLESAENWIQSEDLPDSSPDSVIVREARKDLDRALKIPESFVARKAAAQSRAYHAWAAAREANDFPAFRNCLQEQIDLAREEASFMGFEGANAYDYWIDQFDPGMTASFISPLFDRLSRELPTLVQAIVASPVKAHPGKLRGFPIDRQETFLREVIEKFGFDFSRGRLDRSLHPFCSGSGLDTRMTTRFFEDNPLDSLFSSIHETGHGLYEQGLPSQFIGTALGTAAGMAAHESQSRLWENQVARSRAFWHFWEPRYRQAFTSQLADISSEELYLAVNAVKPIPIRVDSDEVTYNLHIIMRFEIEKALFQGGLQVADLPALWNELSQKYLGLIPANDTEGCLQDVHWSGGAFGYFPSYCLGNMLAAQLWSKAGNEIPDLETNLARGESSALLSWLREKIHSKGRMLNACSLAESVTGQPLSADPLLQYLRDRYGRLYRVC